MQNSSFNYKQWLIILMLLAVVAVLGILEYRHRFNKPSVEIKSQQIELNVSEIETEKITVAQKFIGKIEAINAVEIHPQVSGYVAGIVAHGGEHVKAGDILLVIEQAPFVAALEAAEADKFSAQAEMMNAKSNYERLKKAGKEAVSPSELENAASSYLNSLGKYKQACANLEQAEIDFDHTVLRAPFSGVVGHIALSAGDYVTPQSASLMSIVQYNPIRAVFSVTDKEYLERSQKGLIFSNDVIKLQLSNGKIYENAGKIEYTANELNGKTDSLAVYALFKNNNRALLPNAYVDVLVEKNYDDAVVIDKPLLMAKNDGDYVYIVKKGELKLKKVKVLTENDSSYVLENNFAKNEQLVTQNVESYMLGQKVIAKIVPLEKK